MSDTEDVNVNDTVEGIDHRRTTDQRAGLVFKDRREVPGVAILIMAALALVGFAGAAAQHDATWTWGFGIAVLVLAAVGLAWVFIGRNRTIDVENHRGEA